jgi:predicted permease
MRNWSLPNDVRGAARSILRQPAVAITVVFTLAIGIGGTVGLFSIVDPLLTKPLAVADARGLVRLLDEGRETFTYPSFEQLRGQTNAFSGLAAAMWVGASRRAEVDGADIAVAAQEVSSEYFEVLGVDAAVGRMFTSSQLFADGPVAVVSDAFWRRHFPARDNVIGARIRYVNVDFTVIGVAPAGFFGLMLDRPADFWVPLEQAMPPGSMLRTRGRFLNVVGRLRPGVALAPAAAEASDALDRPIQVERGMTGFSALRARFGVPLLVLQLGVAAILLIGCINAANLMLLRGMSRARELATRSALGASRARIIRQLLTESCLLGIAGAALAVLVAYFVNSALLSFLRPEDAAAARTLGFELNHRLFAALAAVLVASVAIVGLAPALSVTTDASIAELRAGASSMPRRRRRGNRLLAIGQVALSTFVVIGATMFTRSLVNLWSVDAGFETRDVLRADLVPTRGTAQADTTALFEEIRARLSSVSGVDAVGLSSIGQVLGYGFENAVYSPSAGDGRSSSYEQSVSPGFISAMGIELLEGRDFSDADREGAVEVAIVNESFARRFLEPGSATGARFGIAANASSALEIVGVVEDSRWLSLRDVPVPMYYRPFRQRPAPSATLVVHAPGKMAVAERTLQDLARAFAGRVDVVDAVPFATMVGRTLGTERMLAQISTALGIVALVVVAIGLYGLLAFEVSQRARELGIRLALGARNAALAKMLGRDTLIILAAGVPIGLSTALVSARAVEKLLFELSATDPATAALGIGILVAVAAAASYVPVRRIARITPSAVLRND